MPRQTHLTVRSRPTLTVNTFLTWSSTTLLMQVTTCRRKTRMPSRRQWRGLVVRVPGDGWPPSGRPVSSAGGASAGAEPGAQKGDRLVDGGSCGAGFAERIEQHEVVDDAVVAHRCHRD